MTPEQIEIVARALRLEGIPISKEPYAAKEEIWYLLRNNRIPKYLIPDQNSIKTKLNKI